MGSTGRSAGNLPSAAVSSRAVLIDDNPAVRESTRQLLKTVGVELIAYNSPVLFLQEMPETNCILLDVRMPEMSGIEVFRRLRASGTTTPVIFMTGHGHIAMAVNAMRDGAFDFIEKPIDDQRLIDSVLAAIDRDGERRNADMSRVAANDKIARLTAREREIAEMVVEGRSNREIGEALSLSVRTVEGYRSRITGKLEAASLADLINLLNNAKG